MYLRTQFPGARVQASTLDQYLDQLMPLLDQGKLQLPVVTGERGMLKGGGGGPATATARPGHAAAARSRG